MRDPKDRITFGDEPRRYNDDYWKRVNDAIDELKLKEFREDLERGYLHLEEVALGD